MPASRRTGVNLRFSVLAQPDVALTVEMSAGATVADLYSAVSGPLSCDLSTHQLIDAELQAALPESGSLSGLQLTHGQVLELAERDSGRVNLPQLSEHDELRLVHEAGAQLAFAWPLSVADRFERHFLVDRISGQLREVDEDIDADLTLRLSRSRPGIEVLSLESDLDVAVNGRTAPSDAPIEVAPGGLLSIYFSSMAQPTELRVLLRGEHDVIRLRGSVVPYRVRPPDQIPTDYLSGHSFKWRAPSEPTLPKWRWADVALQEGSMFMIYILLMVRTGFAWYYLPFILLPVGRAVFRYRQYRADSREVVDTYNSEIANLDRELGELANRVQTEAFEIARLNPARLSSQMRRLTDCRCCGGAL